MAEWWPTLCAKFESWTGVCLREPMRPMVARIVARIVQSAAMTHEELIALADRDPSARQNLVDEITVGTTWFLRERDGLVELASQLTESGPLGREVLVWSIGCSTGEEPYSLAMLLQAAGLKPRVLATDINRRALARALEARYRIEALADLPSQWQRAFFEPASDGRARVAGLIRAQVTFELHNISTAQAPPRGWSRFDAVVCRNVLIYFAKDHAVEVLDRMVGYCRGGGLIMLGPTERPVLWPQIENESDASPVFEVDRERRIRRRRPTRHNVVDVSRAHEPAPPSSELVRQQLRQANKLARASRIVEALDRLTSLAVAAPNSAEVQLELGLAFKRAGRIEEAARAFRAANAQRDCGWLPSYQLGTCLEQLGEKRDARRSYQETLRRLANGAAPGRAFDSEDLHAMASTVERLCRGKLSR